MDRVVHVGLDDLSTVVHVWVTVSDNVPHVLRVLPQSVVSKGMVQDQRSLSTDNLLTTCPGQRGFYMCSLAVGSIYTVLPSCNSLTALR